MDNSILYDWNRKHEISIKYQDTLIKQSGVSCFTCKASVIIVPYLLQLEVLLCFQLPIIYSI